MTWCVDVIITDHCADKTNIDKTYEEVWGKKGHF